MKTYLIIWFELVLAIVLALVGFFTIKEVLTRSLYFIPALSVRLYFFPTRILKSGENPLNENQPIK